ncbi:hypothetical protein VQD75_004722 [Vibrio alginolyticus]|nr:hypothetical protein [Vibrio alginolyticus]EMD1213664.1 hypothetical protein [Vibrio alginolyticus]
MKLLASILTTAAITGSTWTLAINQPTITGIKATVENYQKEMITRLHLVEGVTKIAPLESLPTLWSEFESYITNTKEAPENIDRVIVLYEGFNSDFTEAKITIGYPVGNAHRLSKNLVALPDSAKAHQFLSRGPHPEAELVDAWGKISSLKSLDAVTEIHYLDSRGQSISSQLSVYYKQ